MAELAEAPRVHHRVRRGLGSVLGPLWRTTFAEPVRDGRLRLRGLSGVERLAARAALVALAAVLGSALFATAWRHTELLPVDAAANQLFVPAGVVGLSFVAFFVAWLAITWGGLRGSAPVRLVVATAYLLLTADFAIDYTSGIGSHSWVIAHDRLLLDAGYFAPPAALAAAALTTRWRGDRWVVRVARVVCLAGVGCLFLGLLWQHVELLHQGLDTIAPSQLGATLTSIDVLLLPLVYVSSIAVVDFALDVSTSLAAPAAAVRRWVGVALVLGLVTAKLWFEVGSQTDYWRAILGHQPQAVIRTVLCVLGLAALTWVVTRFRRSEESLAAKEELTWGGSLVLASPFLGQIVLALLSIVVVSRTQGRSSLNWVDHFPATWLSTYGMFIGALLAVAAGALLMRRSRGGIGDELGSGLVIVGVWEAVAYGISNWFQLGVAYRAVDVTATLLVLVVVLVRARRADTELLVTAGTVLVFSWLVTSRGDYVSFVGGLVGLSGVVVLAFGIIWTLLSGSSFTSTSGRWVPQPARPLIFLGYVLLSVAMLCWNETTHASTYSDDALVGYYNLAIPLAAWLLGRRVITRPERSSAGREPGALPEEVGDGVGAAQS